MNGRIAVELVIVTLDVFACNKISWLVPPRYDLRPSARPWELELDSLCKRYDYLVKDDVDRFLERRECRHGGWSFPSGGVVWKTRSEWIGRIINLTSVIDDLDIV